MIFGWLLLLIPLSIEGLWILVWSRHDNHADRVAAYFAYFPAFAREPWVRSLCSVLGSVASGPVFYLAAVKNRGWASGIAVTGIVIAAVTTGLVILLTLFRAL